MKTKLFLLVLVVLFTSSLYAQGYRIEKVGNDTITTQVGELIAEIPYFDSLPILVEEYGIEKVTEAWVSGKSEIDVSPITKENRWLPLSKNQKKTVFLRKKENKIVSERKTYPPIVFFSWFQLSISFILSFFGVILVYLIPRRKEKGHRNLFITVLLIFGLILFCLALFIAIFPLIGVPIGFLITMLLKKIKKFLLQN